MSVRAEVTRAAGPVNFRRPVVDGWLLTAGLVVLGLLSVALFGERIAPHEPTYFVVEHGSDPRPYDPGVVFPLGSDVLGRDLFSLVLAGAGTTLAIVLAGGAMRVVAGTLIAALGTWWRPLRLLTESMAELVSAIPATLVALVIVKVLVKTDTTVLVFIGALLVMGWAGPYRIVRAEIDRLAHAPFTIGARSLGVSGWRLFWRHQLPHLVPVLAINLAQQVVASLVLVAELGVLGTFVGTTRLINIEESLTKVITGPVSATQIADPPEWGGLLASARTIESLWATRWLVLVPGVAFAVTAMAIALIGFALARRYSRRDVIGDITGRGTGLFLATVVALVVLAGAIPERFTEARSWASDAAGAVRETRDVGASFADAGLRPLAPGYVISRDLSSVVQTGPSSLKVGPMTLDEKWPRDTTRRQFSGDVRSLVTSATGGGMVDAPLVYVGRGISPADDPPPVSRSLFGLQNPDLGTLLEDYADDYASVDVRGKVVLLVRFYGFRMETFDQNGQVRLRRTVPGFSVDEAIARAVKRGAAAVVLVDPDLPFYTEFITSPPIGPVDPYIRLERESPAIATGGIPVVILSAKAGSALGAQLGIDMSPLFGFDTFGRFDGKPSVARELEVAARADVPIARRDLRTKSYAGASSNVTEQRAHVLVWSIRPADGDRSSADVLAAVARTAAARGAPLVFVDFDPSLDPRANAQAVVDALAGRRVTLVVVLASLKGSALQFATPWGDLVPAIDRYAASAGARTVATHDTAPRNLVSDTAPFADVKTIFVSGNDAARSTDLRGDAARFIGYLAGRFALGAEELPR